MTSAPHPPNIAHGNRGPDVRRPDQLSTFVIGLKAPPLASGYERAAWRTVPETESAQSREDLPQASQGLRVTTSSSRTVGNDSDGAQSTDQSSSEPPSPDPSSPVLHTPMDSPPSTRLRVNKDDVPDIEHLFIRDRAPKRVLTGPSQDGGEVAIGMKITDGTGGIRPLTTQGYEISIDILQKEGNYESNKTHTLLIDTGSTDTFAFGKGVFKVEDSNADRRTRRTVLEPRVPWTSSEILEYPTHTSVRHRYDPKLTNDQLRENGPIGRVHYSDGAIAQLGLVQPRTWVLHCYDWEEKQEHQVYFTFRFGVAFAVSRLLYADSTSGILGLGLSRIQHAYLNYSEGRVAPPTFLAALQQKLKPVPAHRRGESMAIYFCLRMVPDFYSRSLRDRYPIQSWMSFNDWPCDHEPEWNREKIIVAPATDPIDRRWNVYLRSIKFIAVDATVRRPVLGPASYLDDAELNFVTSTHPKGILTLLDTGMSILSYLPSHPLNFLLGASVSRFPLHAIQKIHEKLFNGTTTITATEGGANVDTYAVDLQRSWVGGPDYKIQVVYEFEGEKDPVIVHGPFEMFFYQTNTIDPDRPKESLVFPRSPSRDETAKLGLNFFQSMYVSLHHATDGVDFVRMAGQWPEHLEADMEKYYLSGVSST